jgi:hypothetical protein
MTAAMRRVLTDRLLRAKLRDMGLARAAQFSWERTARRHLEAYDEAWRRFQGRHRRKGTGKLMTRYREKMRDWTVAKSVDYTWHGTRITTWPF